jgi:hypothetical protein
LLLLLLLTAPLLAAITSTAAAGQRIGQTGFDRQAAFDQLLQPHQQLALIGLGL